LAARNEEARLPAKLENLRLLDYPPEHIQIIVASDGFNGPDSQHPARASESNNLRHSQRSKGKANALNEAVKLATGDILVFLDVRQTVDANAVSELAACFADPEVGAASGELLLETAPGMRSADASASIGDREGRAQTRVCVWFCRTRHRSHLWQFEENFMPEISAGTLLDDVFVPHECRARRQTRYFQPSAIARDRLFSEKRRVLAQGPYPDG